MTWFFFLLLGLLGLYGLSSACIIAWFWLANRRGLGHGIAVRPDRFFVSAGSTSDISVEIVPMRSISDTRSITADIVVALDISSSMRGENLKQARWGARTFLSRCRIGPQGIHAGLCVFNEQASILSGLADQEGDVDEALERVPEASGGTSILAGLKAAGAILRRSGRASDPDVTRAVVLVTDGQDNPSAVLPFAEELRAEGIDLFCLGVQGADHSLLDAIAGGQGRAIQVDHPEDLVALLEETRLMVMGPVATNGRVELVANDMDLSFEGTTSEHLYLNQESPWRWSIPWLTSRAERVGFQVIPRVRMGLTRLTREPARLTMTPIEGEEAPPKNGEGTEARGDVTVEDGAVRRILVMPWEPVWFWGWLSHPLLWSFWRSLFQDQEAELPVLADPPEVEVDAPPPMAVDGGGNGQAWTPTLVVALGERGIAAASRLRSLASDVAGGLDPEDLRYLFLDTDESVSLVAPWGAGSMDPEDLITFGADLREVHQAHLTGARESDWYKADHLRAYDVEVFDTRDGCRGLRQLGRLAFHEFLRREPERLPGAIADKVAWLMKQGALRSKGDGTPHARVVFLLSTIGGTGSAIFSDVAHMVARHLEGAEGTGVPLLAVMADDLVEGIHGADAARAIQGANRAALMTQIETVKTANRLGMDAMRYPGAVPLTLPRSTNAEFLVRRGETQGDALLDCACLALGMALSEGPFAAEMDRMILGGSGEVDVPAPFAVSVRQVCLPITLWARWSQARLAAQALERSLGISLAEGGYQPKAMDGEEEELVRDLLTNLFQGRPLDGFPEVPHDALPRLFPYIPEVARLDESASKVALILDMLSEGGRADPTQEAGRAARLLVDWSARILGNTSMVHRLSVILAALDRAGEAVTGSHAALRGLSPETVPTERLDALDAKTVRAVHGMLGDILSAVEVTKRYVREWAMMFSEGFPEGVVLENGADPGMVGVARAIHRQGEVAASRMVDYGVAPTWEQDVRADPDHALSDDTVAFVGGRLWWGIGDQGRNIVSLEAYRKQRPLTLKVFGNGWSLRCESPGKAEGALDRALMDVAGRVPSRPASLTSGRTSVGTPDGWVTEDITFDIAFSAQGGDLVEESVQARFQLQRGRSFGSSEAMRRIGHLAAGVPDLPVAVTEETVVAESLGPLVRRFISPDARLDAAVLPLLRYPERLSWFLLAWARGQVVPRTFPGTAAPALAVRVSEGGEWAFLTRPGKVEDWTDALFQFVIRRCCRATDAPLPSLPPLVLESEDCRRLDRLAGDRDAARFSAVILIMARTGEGLKHG